MGPISVVAAAARDVSSSSSSRSRSSCHCPFSGRGQPIVTQAAAAHLKPPRHPQPPPHPTGTTWQGEGRGQEGRPGLISCIVTVFRIVPLPLCTRHAAAARQRVCFNAAPAPCPSPSPLPFPHRSVSGKKLCSSCGQPLGKGAAMIIETLSLYFHIQCFKVGPFGLDLALTLDSMIQTSQVQRNGRKSL